MPKSGWPTRFNYADKRPPAGGKSPKQKKGK